MAPEDVIARTFAKRCEEARAYLRREMNARGLRVEDGWQIVETLRGDGRCTELVMRPIHLHLPWPEDLECVVEMHEDQFIDSHCEP
jgi:hypothetical protein